MDELRSSSYIYIYIYTCIYFFLLLILRTEENKIFFEPRSLADLSKIAFSKESPASNDDKLRIKAKFWLVPLERHEITSASRLRWRGGEREEAGV